MQGLSTSFLKRFYFYELTLLSVGFVGSTCGVNTHSQP